MKNGLYETVEILGAANDDDAKLMIRNNLTNSPMWLVRGLLAIYARQTADEQAAENTRYHNKVGFGAADAEIMSSFAKQCQVWENTPKQNRRFDSPLSPKQRTIATTKMLKYSGQLLRIVQEKKPVEPAAA